MFKNFYKIKYFLKNRQKGMTLVELLVVLSIFALITALVVYDYGSFRSSTSTQNLANDIALSVRKAQSYAIGVRGIGSEFQYGHGIHFTTNPDSTFVTAGSDKAFILFTNINSDFTYDYDPSEFCGNPSEGNECEEILNINTVDKITGIYLNEETEAREGVLDIIFVRPEPDAIFCYRENDFDSSCTLSQTISSATIEVANEEISRRITIWKTGQISTN